jgi:hypothetical protein
MVQYLVWTYQTQIKVVFFHFLIIGSPPIDYRTFLFLGPSDLPGYRSDHCLRKTIRLSIIGLRDPTIGLSIIGIKKESMPSSARCFKKYTPVQCCGSGMFIPDPGSDFFPSQIPDPNCFRPGSRIPIKEFKYFNPKEWFLSSRKYDPGCSSRIPDPDPDFLPIPDPGSLIQGSKRHRIPDPQHCTCQYE